MPLLSLRVVIKTAPFRSAVNIQRIYEHSICRRGGAHVHPVLKSFHIEKVGACRLSFCSDDAQGERPFPDCFRARVPKTKRQSTVNNERLHAPQDNAAEATETETGSAQSSQGALFLGVALLMRTLSQIHK